MKAMAESIITTATTGAVMSNGKEIRIGILEMVLRNDAILKNVL
jgi:hypothetical protein